MRLAKRTALCTVRTGRRPTMTRLPPQIVQTQRSPGAPPIEQAGGERSRWMDRRSVHLEAGADRPEDFLQALEMLGVTNLPRAVW
jgi:hypothetical protein